MKRLVHPKRYNIPTFDEVVAEGTIVASNIVGRELIELLKSNDAVYLSEEDFCDMSKLIDHEGFDKDAAKDVRNILTKVWDRYRRQRNDTIYRYD